MVTPPLADDRGTDHRADVQARFLTSAARPEQFPRPEAPEFAFVGRSNVGKSTLLNALCGAKVARVSNTPGRTQLVNFFDVRLPALARFVDLPGYGFAKVPRRIAEGFEALVMGYIGAQRPVVAVLVLVDARRGVMGDDQEVLQWLHESGHEPWLVITKADKLSKAQRRPVRIRAANAVGVPPDRVFLTSSTLGAGIEELRDQLANSIARSA